MKRVMHMLHPLETPAGEIGSTVRKGEKWADSNGDELSLCVCRDRCLSMYCGTTETPCANCAPSGTARVILTWVGCFNDVPARLIENEHEARSRLWSGLLESMRHAYGADFSVTDMVTVVVYLRVA